MNASILKFMESSGFWLTMYVSEFDALCVSVNVYLQYLVHRVRQWEK